MNLKTSSTTCPSKTLPYSITSFSNVISGALASFEDLSSTACKFSDLTFFEGSELQDERKNERGSQ